MTVCQMELFLVALCFPGTFLSENCWCLASDDDGHEQMLVHIFVPNGGYWVHFLICVCNKVKSFVISYATLQTIHKELVDMAVFDRHVFTWCLQVSKNP